MRMLYFAVLVSASINILVAEPAYAYLDPGSASLFLQAVAAAMLTALGTIAFYWQKTKSFVRRIFYGSKTSDFSEKKEDRK